MSEEQKQLAVRRLGDIVAGVRDRYRTEQRLLSFDEYLALLAAHPTRYVRDASRYVRDAFLHYGTRDVERPWGTLRRFNLFDLSFLGEGQRRDALVGHEGLQNEMFRVLSNFAREGRPNRLVLLHGPNRSARSTLVGCLFRAHEHYSSLDEGALYRFHWVFPSQKTLLFIIKLHRIDTAVQSVFFQVQFFKTEYKISFQVCSCKLVGRNFFQ